MKVIDRGYQPKAFQEMMGRGGAVLYRPKSEPQETKPSEQQDQSHLVPDSPSGTEQMIKMIEQEATEQISGEYQPEATADQCEQSVEVIGPRS